MNKSPIYDPVTRRCVVFQVLKDYLSGDSLMKALWILEDEYSKQHSLPILEYIDEIERVAALGDKKKQLRERLTKELYFSEKIGVDPWEDMSRHKRMSQIILRKTPPPPPPTPTSTTASPYPRDEVYASEIEEPAIPAEPVSSELAVFSRMLKELNKAFSTASKGHMQKFFAYMLSMMNELELSPEAEAVVVTWCQHDGNVELKDLFTLDEMREVIHTAYLWAAEFFGPDQADRLVARALHEVEHIPEADFFPPAQLL